MEQDNELQRLEQFVKKLLTNFTELREEKAQLLSNLRDRDEIISRLREDLSSKNTERSEISDRVSRIVGRIEEWEQTLEESQVSEEKVADETVENPVIAPTNEALGKEQRVYVETSHVVETGIVAEAEAEAAAETETETEAETEKEKAEEERRVQQNLFSMENERQ